MDFIAFLQICLYVFGVLLLVVLILLGIQAIITLRKVDKLVDDITIKSKKFDNMFCAVDKVTDAISSVNEKIIGITFGVVNNIVDRIRHKKDKEN